MSVLKDAKPQLVTTADGSHSLYIPELNEHYHSRHGAIQESQYVFIKQGLEEVLLSSPAQVRILEVGLGTGLNAFLTYLYAEQQQVPIHYYSLEAYPLPMEVVNQLNYAHGLHADDKQDIFQQLHSLPFGEDHLLGKYFTFRKEKALLENFNTGAKFDLIYFDAFAPEKQPELWTEDIFRKMYNLGPPKGILVTYCAKGYVRRNMQAAGFLVEKLPGPPGKREMLRCRKEANIIGEEAV